MFEKIFLFLILCSKFLVVISWKPTADYCKIKCHKKPDEHTACKCKLIEPREIIENDLTKFRKEVVDVHNKYRNQIASGGEKDKGYPEAANMMAVSYNLELEYIAKCYARRFVEMHDVCRDTANPQLPAGQNLVGTTSFPRLKTQSTDLLRGWYNELDDVQKDQRENFIKGFHPIKYKAGDKPIGHFSQFIWWSHTLVGCTRVHNEKHERAIMKNVLICNYAGAPNFSLSANVINRPIYKVGKKCSECPKGIACNSAYPALCGTIDKIPSEDKVETTQDIADTTVDTVLLGNSEGNPSSSRTVRIYQNELLLVFILLVLCRNLNY